MLKPSLNRNYNILLQAKLRHGFVGICETLTYLTNNNKISRDEYVELKLHLIRNKPTDSLHREFYIKENYIGGEDTIKYWWVDLHDDDKVFNKKYGMWMTCSKQQRVEFLEKMIEITRYRVELRILGINVIRI
jgi:hypothetical protein